MKESHILLISIIGILLYITINDLFITQNEKLTDEVKTEDIYENDTSYNNESNLLIPESQYVFNPYDVNRPISELPIQEKTIEGDSQNKSLLVNTSPDTPIVYSLDELTHTIFPSTPSTNSEIEIDTGSGNIKKDILVNNNKLNNFSSIN